MNISIFYILASLFTACMAWQLYYMPGTYGFLGAIASLIAVGVCSYIFLPSKRILCILLLVFVAIKGVRLQMGTEYTMLDAVLYAALVVVAISIFSELTSSQNEKFGEKNTVALQKETINKLKRELETSKVNIAELQCSLSQEQQLRRNAERELLSLSQVSSNKSVLENKNDSLNKEKLELEKSLQESATALISLKSEFNASERENANLREVNDINEKKIQEQNKSIEELNSKILELKNNITVLQKKLGEVAEEKKKFEAEYEDACMNIKQMQQLLEEAVQ